MARESGKPDWHRMTVPVLKNRILILTKRGFSEAKYGARNFAEFVQKASGLVQIDYSQFPPIVELKDVPTNSATVAPSKEFSSVRIRPDFWRAVMDYASGNKYVWDSDKGIARPLEAGDTGYQILPTLTPEVHNSWRREFADARLPMFNDIEKARLNTWVEESLSPRALPHELMREWNHEAQRRVVDVLKEWFEQQHFSPPQKISVSAPRAARLPVETSIEDLRTFIIACVRNMNGQELSELKLPASSALRTKIQN